MANDHVAALRSDAAALAAVAGSAPSDTPVPSCPGWDLGHLVGHVGRVHRWATEAATGGGAAPGRPPKPPEDGLLEWYVEGADLLADALAGLDPDAPAWNFAGAPSTAAFWQRRQPVETAVHRWDAQHAVGADQPVDAELAAAGVDEFVTVLTPFILRDRDGIDVGGSVHLHCTDVDGEWTVRTDDGVYRVELGHAKGDVAARGPASQLLLLATGRLTPDADGIEVFGDRAVLDAWAALASL
jgi:uncharacterized protein (TIGR03083 family)